MLATGLIQMNSRPSKNITKEIWQGSDTATSSDKKAGFKQAKLFFDALDIEDEQLLAQHFRSKQQLRDFHYLRARLESEAPIVRPMLERIDAHFRELQKKPIELWLF